MLRSDDLAPLFDTDLKGPAIPVLYRKGRLDAWDPDTFENTVVVDGVSLPNLTILSAAEAKGFAAGDKVGLHLIDGSWAIVGQFVTPGSAEVTAILDRLSTELGERAASADVAAAEGTISATFTDLATPGPAVTLDIGASGKALVIVSAREVSTTSTPVMSYAISGATTVAADDADSLAITVTGGASLLGAASRLSLASGLNPGSTTFTAKYRRVGATTITFDQRNITVFAL